MIAVECEATYSDLVALRKRLHQHAELANQESKTAALVADFLQHHAPPDHLIAGLAGHGLLAVFAGDAPGSTVAFRCELDALPIREPNAFAHRSQTEGVSHKCGHDGHMAILCGLACELARRRPSHGQVCLLFQPAEETGQGAARYIEEPAFRQFKPERIFALHNLPGFATGHVITRVGTICCASTGLRLQFSGRTAHAAHPETGKSPGPALAEILRYLYEATTPDERSADFALMTPTHASLGVPNFGTTPGEATVLVTLRAATEERLTQLTQDIVSHAKRLAQRHGLAMSHGLHETFPATVNDEHAVLEVQKAASQLDLPVHMLDRPFRWSEDFGHFTRTTRGALVGLGAGEAQPPLHNETYDFPDALIGVGIKFLMALVLDNI